MSRALIDYTAHAEPRQFAGFNPDAPVAGFYRIKLRSGAVYVGIRVWFGAPLDPVTGDEMDRAPRWNAAANGKPIDVERVWPKCAGEPIDRAEHDYLIARQNWAEVNAPNSPQANPRQRIDPLTAPTPF